MIPTPPTTDLAAMESTALEAIDFWKDVPSHAAYWQGAEDTIRAIWNVTHIISVPGVRQWHEGRMREKEIEIAAIRERLEFERIRLEEKIGILEEQLEQRRVEDKLLAGQHAIRAAVMSWAAQQQEPWTQAQLRDALPALDKWQIPNVVFRLCQLHHLVRVTTRRPMTYRVTSKPYETQ